MEASWGRGLGRSWEKTEELEQRVEVRAEALLAGAFFLLQQTVV
jgi:hypothetical protein